MVPLGYTYNEGCIDIDNKHEEQDIQVKIGSILETAWGFWY